MILFAKLVSLISLGLVVVPCCLYFGGIIDLDMVKLLALIGTIGWFPSTLVWMGRELSVDSKEAQI